MRVMVIAALLVTGCSVDLGGKRPCSIDKDCAKGEVCGTDKHCAPAVLGDCGADRPLDLPVNDVAAGDKPRTDSSVSKPELTTADVGKPDAAKLDIGKPDVPNLDLGKPDAGKPDVLKPDVFKPDVFKPDTGLPVCVFDSPTSTFDNCVFAP